MTKKIFVHLGLPKTASTTLQMNFFTKLKKTNYIGTNKLKKNSEFFTDLDNYISFNKNFNENEIKLLKKKFLAIFNNSKKNLLLSQETWIHPTNYFSRSLKSFNIKKSGRYYIFSQWKKLKRLDDFLKTLNVNYQYFLVKRNSIDGLLSLYFQIHSRIIDIFGNEYKNIDFFINKILDCREKKQNFDGELITDTYNIKKIIFFYECVLKKNLEVLDYDNLQQNKNLFVKKLLNILDESDDEDALNIYSSYFNEKLNYKNKKKEYEFDKNMTKISFRLKFPILIYLVRYIPKPIYKSILNLVHFFYKNQKININLSQNLKKKLIISNEKLYNDEAFAKYFKNIQYIHDQE